MKSFKEYISEQPVIQPTPAVPTSPSQAQSSEDGQVDPADMCYILLMIYQLMECWTDNPQKSCPIWKDLLIKHGCMSAPVTPEEDKPHPDDDDEYTIPSGATPTKQYEEFVNLVENGGWNPNSPQWRPSPSAPSVPTPTDDDGEGESTCDEMKQALKEKQAALKACAKELHDLEQPLHEAWKKWLDILIKNAECQQACRTNPQPGLFGYQRCMSACASHPEYGENALNRAYRAWRRIKDMMDAIRERCELLQQYVDWLKGQLADCGDAFERSTRKPDPKRPTTDVAPVVSSPNSSNKVM